MPLLRGISPADPVSQLALEGLEKFAPILQDAEFYTKGGPSDTLKDARTADTKTLITRALNTDNSPAAPTPAYSTATKRIISFDATVDVVLEDRNEDPEAELALQTRLEAEEASWELQEMFFEGDNGAVSTDFDGMRNLVDASWVLTDGVVVPAGSSDTVVEAQQLAVEKLMQHAARVRGGASHVYMNEYLKIRWLTIAKNLGYYRQSKDELGNVIDMIGNLIVRGAGYKKAGTPLLPFSEAANGGSSSSMFFVRWGVKSDLTCLTSIGCKGRYSGQSGNQIINNVNLDMTMHLQNITALVQSKGWKLSA